MRLVGLDQFADRAVHQHDLADRLAPASLGALDQDLGHDRDQALRQEGLGLLALLDRQRVDDAVDGLDRARGVQRAEHQVAGLGGRHRHADRFGVAHFADQDHVRVLAHRGAHALGEAGQVRAQLALDHLRLAAGVHELDRILEADDVQAPRLVELRDHRGERGRLARAGRPGDQDHALVVVEQFGDHRRQAERVQRRGRGRDRAKHRAHPGFLAEQVHAVAAAFLADVGEVQVVSAGELAALGRRHDLVDVALELCVGQVAKADRQQVAVHPEHRRHADG